MAVGKESILRAAQSIESIKGIVEEKDTQVSVSGKKAKKVANIAEKDTETNDSIKDVQVSTKRVGNIGNEKLKKDSLKTLNTKANEEKSTIIELNVESIETTESTIWDNEIEEIIIIDLKDSIQKYGMIMPLIVTEGDNNKFKIVDGNKRIKVARELEISRVNCIVLENTSKQLEDIRKELEKFQYGYRKIKNKEIYKTRYAVVSSFGKDMPDYLL